MKFSSETRLLGTLGVLVTATIACIGLIFVKDKPRQETGTDLRTSAFKQSNRWPKKADTVDVGSTRPSSERTPAVQETGEATFIPEEWESPLMDVLQNEKQGNNERVRGLIYIATVTARGVPSVQEECLKHLLYSLSDNDRDLFQLLSTTSSIPIEVRKRFLQQTLDLRPQDLCIWLSERLIKNQDAALVQIGQSYLKQVESEPQ
ncbi:MAG: hypothetical protein WAL87_03755 [Chthoniobacterales bacterium]